MASAAELVLSVKGQNQTQGMLRELKGGLSDIGKITTGILSASVFSGAGQKITAFIGDSIQAASALEESFNAVNLIFGDAADRIVAFGEVSATQAGLSQAAFQQMATPLGAMLKNAGLNMDEVSGKTIELTQRAADMASVFDTDVEQSLTAIQAALRGEADPIERFGVSVKAAEVDLHALAMTGKTSASELSNLDKAMSRIDLIMRQTSDTAGDFVNTSDSLANTTKASEAQMEDLRAKLGEELLPAMRDWKELQLEIAQVVMPEVVTSINDIKDAWGFLVDALAEDVNIPILGKLGTWNSLLGSAFSLGKATSPFQILKGIISGEGTTAHIGTGGGSEWWQKPRTAEDDPRFQLAEEIRLRGQTNEGLVEFASGLGGAARQLADLNDVMASFSSAASGIHGRPTREEAELQLRMLEIDQEIAGFRGKPRRGSFVNPATGLTAFGNIPGSENEVPEALQKERDQLRSRIEQMDLENRIQEQRLTLADQTLLTEAEQARLTGEMIPLIERQSFWVRANADAFEELVPAVRDLLALLRDPSGLAPGAVAPSSFTLGYGVVVS
jgi:hypothetical protein